MKNLLVALNDFMKHYHGASVTAARAVERTQICILTYLLTGHFFILQCVCVEMV